MLIVSLAKDQSVKLNSNFYLDFYLVKEDVLAVEALGGVLLKDALLGDSVLLAQLLPELEADLVAALPQLEHDHFARHFDTIC